jgi:hypothetical protein
MQVKSLRYLYTIIDQCIESMLAWATKMGDDVEHSGSIPTRREIF